MHYSSVELQISCRPVYDSKLNQKEFKNCLRKTDPPPAPSAAGLSWFRVVVWMQ